MSSPQTAQPGPTVGESATGEYKTMITWRGVGTDRLEQARVHLSGARIKTYGRIIASANEGHEAFSASYELVTNDAGVTRRLSVHLVRASGEMQLTITRDGEHNWLVRTPSGTVRSDFHGAEDVDLALSPMFNALPIRRYSLASASAGHRVEVPVVYLYLPEAAVEPATLTYTAGEGEIAVDSPVATSTITVDDHGFVQNYAGLAERV